MLRHLQDISTVCQPILGTWNAVDDDGSEPRWISWLGVKYDQNQHRRLCLWLVRHELARTEMALCSGSQQHHLSHRYQLMMTVAQSPFAKALCKYVRSEFNETLRHVFVSASPLQWKIWEHLKMHELSLVVVYDYAMTMQLDQSELPPAWDLFSLFLWNTMCFQLLKSSSVLSSSTQLSSQTTIIHFQVIPNRWKKLSRLPFGTWPANLACPMAAQEPAGVSRSSWNIYHFELTFNNTNLSEA